MSLIDWSDPHEMLGLLIEYVDDERNGEDDDVDRAQFLDEIAHALARVGPDLAASLRRIHESRPREFAKDPVMRHIEDCIAELERIEKDAGL
jgi:hypothetical protein